MQFCKFVDECKSLVPFFKKSTNLQKSLNTTLKSACETRWNSVLAMLKSIRDNYSDVSGILLSRNELKKIENISIDLLNQAIDFLEFFNYSSEELQQSQNPTLYLCFPHYLNLSAKCNLNGRELNIIKEFKENVGKFLKQVWEPEIQIEHLVSTFLYPLCKTLPMIKDDKKEEIYKYIEDISKQRNDQYSIHDENQPSSSNNERSIFSAFRANQEELPTNSIRGIKFQ